MRYLVLFVLIISSFVLYAQQSSEIERVMERIDLSEESGDISDFIDILEYFIDHPLDINHADADSLRQLFLFSEKQIENLLTFRDKHGNYESIRELYLVGGFNESDILNITSFVCIGKGNADNMTSKWRNELIARVARKFPLQEGYKRYNRVDFSSEKQWQTKCANRFKGQPYTSSIRYNISDGRWSFGLIVDNDAGEPVFSHHQPYGVDFLSAHIAYNAKWGAVILGDYRVKWGQGLVAWNGFSIGKTMVGERLEKVAKTVQPYTSFSENGLMRGISSFLRISRRSQMEAFISTRKRDASLSASDSLHSSLASLIETGFHRNQNEISTRRQVNELAVGMAYNYNTSNFRLGIHSLYYNFSPELLTNDEIYRRYYDNGKRRLFVGVDYKYKLGNCFFAGETAMDKSGNMATVNNIRFNAFQRTTFNLLWRYYDRSYRSYYAAGFGEFSGTTNEEGIYSNVTINLSKRWSLLGFADYYRFFSPRYGALIPGSGFELGIESRYIQRNANNHTCRIRYKERPEDLKGAPRQSVQRRTISSYYKYEYSLGQNISMGSRLNLSYYGKNDVQDYGWLIAQDVILTSSNGRNKLQFRIAYFDIDSYQSRIYLSEHNPLYVYEFTSFYDRGLRSYLNISHRYRKLTCYFKGGITYYPQKEAISSYLTEIEGNKVWNVILQIRWKF